MSDIKFKELKPDIDLSKEHIIKYNWDVYLHDKPYQVIKIDGYVHTVQYKHHGEFANDLYMYPRDEEPCYNNLEKYCCKGTGVCWGFKYEPYNYINKYGTETNTWNYHIIRNGETFYPSRTLERTLDLLHNIIPDHPIDFDMYDYEDNLIGRNVFWKGQPCIINSYQKGCGTITLIPDGIDHFEMPGEFKNDGDYFFEDDRYILEDMFASSIYWFRE